jgi:hypothetical protein
MYFLSGAKKSHVTPVGARPKKPVSHPAVSRCLFSVRADAPAPRKAGMVHIGALDAPKMCEDRQAGSCRTIDFHLTD